MAKQVLCIGINDYPGTGSIPRPPIFMGRPA
jgi:hypothetical protein